MKLITYEEKHKPDEICEVYETVEEMNASGKEWTANFNGLEVGMYFLCHNGYFIPLKNIRTYYEGKYRRYCFPRCTYTAYIRTDGTYKTPKIVYNPEYTKKKMIQDGDVTLFVQMVFAGMKPNQAWYLIRKSRGDYGRKLTISYFDLLQSDKLIKTIKEYMMATMKEGLESNDMDSTWFASQLKNIVEDKNATKEVRLFALQKVEEILNTAVPSTETAKQSIEEVKLKILSRQTA